MPADQPYHRHSNGAGRQPASVHRGCILYTTLSPCSMCSGAILLYGIPRVVIGENRTFLGEEELLRSRGVSVEVLQNEDCMLNDQHCRRKLNSDGVIRAVLPA
jgi:tRNA(Arg) A34 adenosine deaminase TadA